jgi:hypothetical protein
VAFTSTANAQAPAAAEALFEQGRQALAAGDYATACARFRASDAIEPGAGVRANIGTCEEKRGRLASAWVAFKEALNRVPPGDEERRAKIAARVAALEVRLPHLLLTLEPGAPSTTTATDEAGTLIGSAGTWGVALPFDPGPHRLNISAPGYPMASLEVVLVEGQTATLAVGPGHAAPPAPPPARADAGVGLGPWIVGGVGVVGLVVGGVLGGIVIAKKSDATVGCNDATRTCTPAGKSAAQQGTILGPASTVSLVLGGAALAAGGLWLGLGKGPDKSAAAISVGPVAGGGLVRVGGTW